MYLWKRSPTFAKLALRFSRKSCMTLQSMWVRAYVYHSQTFHDTLHSVHFLSLSCMKAVGGQVLAIWRNVTSFCFHLRDCMGLMVCSVFASCVWWVKPVCDACTLCSFWLLCALSSFRMSIHLFGDNASALVMVCWPLGGLNLPLLAGCGTWNSHVSCWCAKDN